MRLPAVVAIAAFAAGLLGCAAPLAELTDAERAEVTAAVS